MAESLLAHLYSRIRGSQEDIATLSLQYILSSAAELNEAFTRMISQHLNVQLPESLRYRCQSVGDEQERPDMAGVDTSGQEVVLCEMKFYAGLTANQPLTYLKRLGKEGGSGLVFICPRTRQAGLWARLQQLCKDEAVEDVSPWCMKVNGIPMAAITWAEVLEQLRHVAAACAVESLSDIQQLEGYCNQMDSDAFVPFQAEELTAEMAKRITSYYDIVDETIRLLDLDKSIETAPAPKSKASTHRYGYWRPLWVNNHYIISVTWNFGLWQDSNSIETPFWVRITDMTDNRNNWHQSAELQKRLLMIPDMQKCGENLALMPPLNATFDEVCEDLKNQILSYIKQLQLIEKITK